jgi:hypothetical protein
VLFEIASEGLVLGHSGNIIRGASGRLDAVRLDTEVVAHVLT